MEYAHTVASPVRLRTNEHGDLLNVPEINGRLGVDIRSGACAWRHIGGGWWRLDLSASDALQLIQ